MIKRVSDSYKHNLFHLIVGPLLKMIEAVFDLFIPLFMKAVIDLQKYGDPDFIPNKISRSLAYLLRHLITFTSTNQPLNDALNGLVIILIMGIIGFLTTMITQYIAARTALKVGTEVRNSLYQKSLQLSKSEKEKIGNSKLLTVLNSDTYQVQQGILIFIRLIVRAPFIIIGALVISFLLDYRIGIVFASIVPIVLIIIFVVMAKSSKGYVSIQGQLDDISNKTSDTINGIKVIKSLNREEYEQSKFFDETNSYHKKAVNVNKINSLINPLTFAIIASATILVVLIGGKPILGASSNEGVLLATTIMTEVSYLAQISFTLMQLTNVILILTKAKVSRKRCDEILSVEPSIHNVANPITKVVENGEPLITFDNVSFSFEKGGNYALKDISFSLNKGESLGIIGGTGSGKSTIISLIERFMDASDGHILYKGDDIKKYDLSMLRKDIALVNQKSSLFKGTIKSNMLIANPNASDEEIIKALKDAEAYEFVSKYEDTINHEVIEEGKNFSGGQRQRLCIARALIKKPEIIILDDSTSALDLLTDKKVRTNISNNYKGITKIIVSQRVATVSNSDQILVLEGGHLLNIGSHEELLKSSSVYKETFESQVKKEGE